MSTFVSTTTGGNWSTLATWATQDGGAVSRTPADGDTVVILSNVTVDSSLTVGLDGATGSTAAVSVGNGSTGDGIALTVGAGLTLTLKGDLALQPANLKITSLVLAAGASLVFNPPAGANYKINISEIGTITCNGTSANRCAISTDLTRNSGNLAYGVYTSSTRYPTLAATFTDFINLGTNTATQPGLKVLSSRVNVTDCTFTNATLSATCGTNTSSFSRNVVNARNVLTNAVTISLNTEGVTSCTIDSNAFKGILYLACKNTTTVTNNVLVTPLFYSLNMGPGVNGTCNNNVIWYTETSGSQRVGAYCGFKDCYFYMDGENTTDPYNPHYIATNQYNVVFDGLIFDCNHGISGDIVHLPSGAPAGSTVTVKNCIAVPGEDGLPVGKLVSNVETPSVGVICDHNTFYSRGVEHGLVGLCETASSYAGQLASCQSNLVWSDVASTDILAINSSGSGTPALDTVTIAGHNGFWNPTAGTITANGVSTPNVPGYNGIVVSAAGFPSAQIGTGDVDVTGSGGPGFVDSTRNWRTWSAQYGADGTAAGALAYLQADPTLLSSRIADLLSYVRAGFVPTNAALQAAHDSANGGWIGAVEGVLPNPIFGRQIAISCMMGI